MHSKYHSRCKRCSARIKVGQPIYWSKETGALCLRCGDPSGHTGVPSYGTPAPSVPVDSGQNEWRIDWPDLKKFVQGVWATEKTPDGFYHQRYVFESHIIRVDESFTGYSRGQCERWTREGFVAEGLKLDEFNPPLRDKRKLRFAEEGDEFHLDLALAGHDNYMSEWTQRESIPGVRIDLQVKFSGDVNARIVNDFNVWTNQMIYALDSIGVDSEINYVYWGKSGPDFKRPHTTIIRLKKENEAVDFTSISPMLSPAAFRTFAFAAIAMQGKDQGFGVTTGISTASESPGWTVTASEDKTRITVTTERNARGEFPAESMTAQLREAIHAIHQS
jgi:hypothetical protein